MRTGDMRKAHDGADRDMPATQMRVTQDVLRGSMDLVQAALAEANAEAERIFSAIAHPTSMRVTQDVIRGSMDLAQAALAEAQAERDRINARVAEIRRRHAPDWMLARYATELHALEVRINQLHEEIFILQNHSVKLALAGGKDG